MLRQGVIGLVLLAVALVAACGRGSSAGNEVLSQPQMTPLTSLRESVDLTPTAVASPSPAAESRVIPTPVPSPTEVPVTTSASPTLRPAQRVRPGVEVLLQDQVHLVRGKRVALLTHAAGVDGQGRSTVDLLAALPDARLVALFAPEHGLAGRVQAGAAVGDERDQRTGLPVYSLYGERTRPTPAQLRGVDTLVVDLQDVGLRFYTYVATLGEVLRAAAEQRVSVVVLDRPAPLGGQVVEGNVLDPRFASFVGPFPLPSRYGLTTGELSRLLNEHFGLGADLHVVSMDGWRREQWFDQTGLAWVPPSPNLPGLDAATAYAGTVLFEGTNLSEGRGTPRPFQWIGAPWVEGPRWAEALNVLALPGARFEPVAYTPETSKHAGQHSSGVALNITNREQFRPIATALHMLATVRRLHPGEFSFRADFFDLLAGTDATRKALEANVPVREIVASWQPQQEAFEPVRRRYLQYR